MYLDLEAGILEEFAEAQRKAQRPRLSLAAALFERRAIARVREKAYELETALRLRIGRALAIGKPTVTHAVCACGAMAEWREGAPRPVQHRSASGAPCHGV